MRTMTPEERTDEVRRIEYEDGWPNWPVLPMKHLTRKDEGGAPVLGLMFSTGGAKVYVGAVMGLRGDLDAYPTEKFSSFEDMVAAGWVGD